jgi:hypothetical protein
VFNNSISKYLLKVSGYNPTIEAASAKEPANATSPDFFIISYTQLTCLGSIFFVTLSLARPSLSRSIVGATVINRFNSYLFKF